MLTFVGLIVASLVLALLLAALLPGAGLFAAAVVILLALGIGAWLLFAGASGTTPSEAVGESHEASLLGPGGPDDPR